MTSNSKIGVVEFICDEFQILGPQSYMWNGSGEVGQLKFGLQTDIDKY